MSHPAPEFNVLGGSGPSQPTHSRGARARVLLTSVFGPYDQDDEYGSRHLNPMELYQNQVTRTQGPFSLRMFHRSWGMMLIQANIAAPCTVLDFPVLDRFIEELTSRRYDVIGIGSIVPNLDKVKAMCKLIRRYQPQAEIVIGGHVANAPDLAQRVDADHIVRGDGVAWFRRYLGQPDDQPLRHPAIASGIGTRAMGVQLRERTGDVAAALIPSVGCPVGCNFCSTSAMFGGKGRFVDFYPSGDELFHVMCELEARMKVQSFFVMDENFLLHRRRALRLLELMQQHGKAWALYVFSSARVLRSYTMDQLVRLGISWVWMGIEGEDSQYTKLNGVDTFALVRQLQANGIRVLGSTIIGLEEHTPRNIDAAIDYAVGHDTDFHQFMLYTPIPGTPLHKQLTEQGMMKRRDEFDEADIHGQYIFNYRHPNIPSGAEAEMIVRAFDRDFAVNGPSVTRIVRSTLAGWLRHKNHPDPCVRRRFAYEARELGTIHTAAVAGARLYYRHQPALYAKLTSLLHALYREFGWKARLYGALGSRYILHKLRREERRLDRGGTYEPPTFYERNEAVTDNPAAAPAVAVDPLPRTGPAGPDARSDRRAPSRTRPAETEQPELVGADRQ
ncbi:MAG: B12-binding domain-containing radical SAM protein [Pirellulales bacterium]